jgi:uncharacterized RDD family membrane protein YckC
LARLVVNPTSSSRREIPLSRTLLSVGRDPSNDIVLPDAMVSRRHAVIEYRGNQYFLRDCNSSNGSLVNGDKISERGLRDGDLVAIGTARLLFREEAEVESGAKVVPHPSAPRLQCRACGADYRQGDHYCRQCGGVLTANLPPKAVCVSCGTVVPLPAHFCTACGTALPGAAPEHAPEPALVVELEGAPEVRPAEAAPPPDDDPASMPPPRPAPMPHGTAAVSALSRLEAPPASRPALDVGLSGPRPVPPAASMPTRSAPTVTWPPGGFVRRAAAAALDAAAVLVLQLVVASPAVAYWTLRDATEPPPFAAVLLSAVLAPVALALAAVYYIYFWGLVGRTPGKRALGLVVQADDGTAPIGTLRAAMRLFGYLLSGALLGAGFLMALSGGRALHDRLAGTRVVRRARS